MNQTTTLQNLKHLPLRPDLKPKLVLASPPCKYFSYARIRSHGYNEKGIAEGLKLVATIFEAIYYLKPEKWIIENPHGILKRVMPEPTTSIEYEAYDIKNKKTDLWSDDRSLKRAFIPYHVSKSIKNWVEANTI